jgi:AAA domain
MHDDNLLARAKQILPAREVLRRLGYTVPDQDKVKFCSPLRKDHKPSCTFYEGLLCDWSTNEKLTGFDVFMQLKVLDAKQAFVPFVELAGLGRELNKNGEGRTNGGAVNNAQRDSVRSSEAFDWDKLVAAVTDNDLANLGKWRGYSPDLCRYLLKKKLIGKTGTSWAFPVVYNDAVVSAHIRKPDDPGWFFSPKLPNGVTPLVIGDLNTTRRTIVGESQWDILSVMDQLGWHHGEELAGIATRGGSNGKLAALAQGEVFLLPQNDEAGQKWLAAARSNLKRRARIIRTPAEYKDAGEWLKSGDTTPELVQAIGSAEVVEPMRVEDPFEKAPGAQADAQKITPWKSRPLFDFANSEIDHSQTLLANRFLCRGGGLILVGPSGIGKSSASIQCATLWACGLEAFGIKPRRPLRILIVQAEDDDGDITEMARMMNHLGLTEAEKQLVQKNVHIAGVNDKAGDEFLTHLKATLEEHQERGICFDLVIINPLTAYIGGDETRPEICTSFLRTGINPILTKHNCAALVVHHPPKTSNQATDKFNAHDWQYRGAGSAHITNWSRAYIVIEPIGNGVFRFIAAKRGSRIGWDSPEKFFAHSKDGTLNWLEANGEQVSEAKSKLKGSRADILKLVPTLDPISQSSLVSKASEAGIGRDRAKGFISVLVEEGIIFEWKLRRSGVKSAVGYCQRQQPDDTNKPPQANE